MRGRAPVEPTTLKALRFPKSIEQHLMEQAVINERSFTAEVVYRLRRDMQREKKRVS